MVIYDPADNNAERNLSVAIPGIDRLLIIGDSDTAINFSTKIVKFTNYNNIYNSKNIEGAVKLLKSVKVSVVIIDGDSEIDPVSCSRLISIQNSSARIIYVSSETDLVSIINMKNNGMIHAFISLPCDDIFAHTIIVQEQSKFHINKTLSLILTDPPTGTPLSKKLKKSPYELGKSNSQFLLKAVSIVYHTVSKYNILIDHDSEVDPVLFSSYFSAISIFSDSVIKKPGTVESFEFNDQIVYVKNIDEVQYIFVFKDATQEKNDEIEQLVHNISQKLFLAYGDTFKKSNLVTSDEDIEALIRQYLPSYQQENFMEADKKAKIINIHEPNDELAAFFDETARAYEVHYVDTDVQLLDMINDETYEIVIINNFNEDFKWNKYLLNIVKDESPFSQSIAIIDSNSELDVSSILNVNDLDLIIDMNSTDTDNYYDLFKKSIERSKTIQDGIVLTDFNRLYRLKHRPELMKAMLRRNNQDLDEITNPKFNSLLVMIGDEKFYSHYHVEQREIISSNESLFLGFIDSLLTFTDELKNSPLIFSGIKYGKSNIIVKEVFEYHFIYFIGELDQTNYDIVNDVLKAVSNEIYEVIKYDVNPHVLSDGLGLLIDIICSGINEKFIEEINS